MDPTRRTDARFRRPRDDPVYSMVKLPRHMDAIWAMTSEDSEFNGEGKMRNLIPSLWCGLVILFVFLMGLVLYHHLYHGLPTPLTTDNIVAGRDIFIAERAKSDLIGLAQIGEKVVGSYENEVLAVDYLTHHLQQIQAQATNNKSVEIDFARGSGAYFLSTFTNVYFNVGNLIARLSDGNGSNVALLLNCHYDTHPSSPGASDNGLHCAAMLEVLRVLSQSETKLRHDVIFLFNGAEENPLQASHAFVTTHPWAADVRAFLNYDSAGFGGREALFQSGPKSAWLNAYYASVAPHPHTTAVITDIFESGLIPSDTDFRIFRDYGNFDGLDFAHYTGGYVYHTLYDNYHIIPDGSYQHTGDNMLAMVKTVANAPEMVGESVKASAVFYDFLGLFVIRYSTTIAMILNIITVVLALASPLWPSAGCSVKETARGLSISLLVQMLGIVLGFGLCILIGMILDWTNNAMSWFSTLWLTIGLFIVPMMIPMLGMNWALTARPIEQSRLGVGHRVQFNTQAVAILWAIVLIVLTVYGLKSAYVITIIVGFVSTANIITSAFKLQRLLRVWLAIYIGVGLLIPTVYMLWVGSMVYSFLPIMGRSGSQIIPDLYISVMFALITSIVGSFWAPLISVVRRPQVLIFGFSLAAVLSIIAATITPIGFPYSVDLTSPKPQRFWLIHTERTLHDIDGNVTYNDGGFWIQHLDRNGPRTFREYISEYSNATTVGDSCIDAVFCGMPLLRTRNFGIVNGSRWIPSELPTAHFYQPSSLSAQWNDTSAESRRLFLNLTGPDHMIIFFALRDGVTLSNWSFTKEIPLANTWNERLVYFVKYDYAIKPELPTEIWLDFVVPDGVNPAIDISLNAHYLHNTTTTSASYRKILNELPLWVAPLHWTATHKSYIF